MIKEFVHPIALQWRGGAVEESSGVSGASPAGVTVIVEAWQRDGGIGATATRRFRSGGG